MSSDISNVAKWALLIKENTPEKVLQQIIERAHNDYNFDFIDDVILFIKVVFWLLMIGIFTPPAIWAVHRIYKSIKKRVPKK